MFVPGARPWAGLGKVQREFAKIADSLVSELDAGIVFIPFSGQVDCRMATEIASMMKHKESALVISHHSPREIMAIVGQMDIIIGMRLHSLIFASAMGVPIVGIIYQPKVKQFLKLIQQEKSGTDLERLEFESFMKQILSVWSSRNDIADNLRSRFETLRREEDLLLELKDLLI